MRNNFLPFACGARNSIYLQRSSKNLPTTPVLDQKEEEFIADVYEVLRASHYSLLTKDEWELATSENFNLNLPMKVSKLHRLGHAFLLLTFLNLQLPRMHL